MPQPYNLTNITDADNLYEVAKAANDLSSSGLAIVILLTSFIITYFSFRVWGSSRAFTASSFITFIISVFLVLQGFIAVDYAFVFILMTVVGVVWLILFG